MVGEHEPAHVALRVAAHGNEVHVGRDGEDEGGLHLTLEQQLLLQVGRRVQHVVARGVDAVQPRQQRPHADGGAAGLRAHAAAREVGKLTDRAVSAHDRGEGRAVVDLVHHQRLVAGPRDRLLDDRVHVAEARVVGTRHDAADRRGRALALVDGDVQPRLAEPAPLQREVVPGVDALETPVEREADVGQGLGLDARRGQRGGGRGGEEGGAAGQRHGWGLPVVRVAVQFPCRHVTTATSVVLRVAQPVTRRSAKEKMA